MANTDQKPGLEKEILRLEGKAAKAFLEYDSRTLSKKERDNIKSAKDYYQSQCDC